MLKNTENFSVWKEKESSKSCFMLLHMHSLYHWFCHYVQWYPRISNRLFWNPHIYFWQNFKSFSISWMHNNLHSFSKNSKNKTQTFSVSTMQKTFLEKAASYEKISLKFTDSKKKREPLCTETLEAVSLSVQVTRIHEFLLFLGCNPAICHFYLIPIFVKAETVVMVFHLLLC